MEPEIRNVSDTALLAAMHRAVETERPGGIFRDPYARRLAVERGERLYREWNAGAQRSWLWATRTWAFDQVITQEVERGVDLVINLAAGLDARPYRMKLPPSLTWIEVDFPDIIAYKQELLRGETPACRFEAVGFDLADEAGRPALLRRLAAHGTNALVISEGLIVYLSREQVVALARDLAAEPALRRWATELGSPGMLKRAQASMNPVLAKAQAPLRFGPEEGPEFFRPLGWAPLMTESFLRAAARRKILPWPLRLMSLLPERKTWKPDAVWVGICLLGRDAP